MIDFLLPYASWPLALAFIIAYSAGMVWYHPKVFGTVWWAQQPHRDPEAELAKMRELMVNSAADLFFATVLIIILFNRFAYEGFILLLLTVGVGSYTGNVAAGGSRLKWIIDAGYLFVQYMIILLGLIWTYNAL